MGLENILSKDGFLTTSVEAIAKWAQKNSAWPMPLGISCCGIEMMAFAAARFDVARFGSEVFRMTPRQSDILLVAGTVTYKMAWVVRKIYDQMPDPKWVMSMGVCASTGGMFRSYSVVQGIDQFLPVDVYISGCPPRPEAVIQGLMTIQEKIQKAHRPDLINLGKNVSMTPTGEKFDSKLVFDPLKKRDLVLK
ncbi:MAG: NADH-quinone oxidoreductase subunit B [Desulfobulbaceae bacterium]|nr:NADH-quinone oxidoreductase subunit B [Candidatus Kapabacteria bacterium]MBS4000231.1 NADH-quinone oxidoreductase subunit B [Desulfobulbaceae bacterium]